MNHRAYFGGRGASVSFVAAALSVTVATPPVWAEGDASVEEVVVTAQRRSERAVDVPVAISAFGAAQLEDANVAQLQDLSRVAPGFRFDYSGGPYAQPSIRGVGSSVIAAGVGPNIGIYVDGFYAPNTVAANLNLVNIDGIQVLKGPQGTLFGRNTTGGAVLVTTKAPSHQSSGVAELSYGRFNAASAQAYVTGELAQTVAADFGASYSRGDGYVRDIATDDDEAGQYENWSARVGLLFDATDDLSFLLRYEHEESSDPTQVMLNAGSFLDGGPNTITAAVPGSVVPTQPGDVALNAGEVSLKTDKIQLTTRWNLGAADLTSYTQYRKDVAQEYLDQDATSVDAFNIGLHTDDELLTQEFLWTSASPGALQWTTGIFLYRDRYHFDDVTASLGGSPYVQFTHNGSVSKTYALYADATYEVTQKLFLTAGLRWSHDEVDDAYFYIPVGVLLPNPGPETMFPAPDVSYSKTVPRVVVRYKPTDNSSVYASYSEGFKSPFVNVGGQSTDEVKAENITDYEVGYKYSRGAASFDLSAYHYDYKNLQVATYTGAAAIINNAASARIRGAELQAAYMLTEHFDFNLGVAYTDAKYKSYPDAAGYAVAVGGFPGTSVDASGFQMQRAPKESGNLGVRYRSEVAGGELTASANLFYTSKFYFDAAHIFPQSSYETLGLRVEWTDPSSRYTFAVYGNNVTDSRYRLQTLGNQLSLGQIWSAPATWGVSMRAKL